MWFPKRSTRNLPTQRKQARGRLAYEALEDRRLLSATPNDPHFHQQWGLEVTNAAEAWEISTGSTQVTMAVIDGGIDYTHPTQFFAPLFIIPWPAVHGNYHYRGLVFGRRSAHSLAFRKSCRSCYPVQAS